ncbi:MAG TPA: ThuA domain-containing protein [Polyangiaceae bacterium]|nr:ThuA domain-containing protein [Polyangiaceae bacterium]
MPRSVKFVPLVFCLLSSLACDSTQDGSPKSDSAGSPSTAGGRAGEASSAVGGAGVPNEAGGTSGTAPARAGAASALGGASSAGGASGGAQSSTAGSSGSGTSAPVSLLVFSRTTAYRHDSIPAGIQALTKLASDRGWQLAATEDASKFSDTGLAGYNVVIFLSTTGDVLDDSQQAAFERFIRAGNGFIGVHSATDTEYDWAWYGGLVGAYFLGHPAVQAADVIVEDAQNPATAQLPSPWHRSDEWYAFKSNPRANVHVLLSLDEQSYSPGDANMNGDHPIAWCHEYDGGRAFYTALGHTSESYSDPLFMGQLAGAVSWVLAR